MSPTVWRLLLLCAFCVATWGFLKDVSGIPSSWMPNDKVMHTLVFLTLTTLWQASFRQPWFYPVAMMAGYGALIEVLQGMTPVRSADAMDWLADMVGVGLAFLLWPMLRRTLTVSDHHSSKERTL